MRMLAFTCHRCETICAWAHEVVFNPKRGRIIVDLEEPDNHNLRLCIQCGRCADACPVDAIYQDFNILTTSEQGIYRLDPEQVHRAAATASTSARRGCWSFIRTSGCPGNATSAWASRSASSIARPSALGWVLG